MKLLSDQSLTHKLPDTLHLDFISAEDYALKIGHGPKLEELSKQGMDIPLVDGLSSVPPHYRDAVLSAYQKRAITVLRGCF